METVIKDFLYWVAIGSGSIFLTCLFITGMIRAICILIDHLKVVNVMRKALTLYIETNRKDIKLTKEDLVEGAKKEVENEENNSNN